jgi:hypothetical protein
VLEAQAATAHLMALLHKLLVWLLLLVAELVAAEMVIRVVQAEAHLMIAVQAALVLAVKAIKVVTTTVVVAEITELQVAVELALRELIVREIMLAALMVV